MLFTLNQCLDFHHRVQVQYYDLQLMMLENGIQVSELRIQNAYFEKNFIFIVNQFQFLKN